MFSIPKPKDVRILDPKTDSLLSSLMSKLNKIWDATINEEELVYISSYQILSADKNMKSYYAQTKLVKNGYLYATIAVKLLTIHLMVTSSEDVWAWWVLL